MLKAHVFAILLAIFGASSLVGCDSNDGPAESAGKRVDNAVDDAGDAIEDACEDATDKDCD